MDPISWAELPIEPILNVFSYLDFPDLIHAGLVNHFWHDASLKEELWKVLFTKYFVKKDTTLDLNGDLSYWEVFSSHYIKWGRYIGCYANIRRIWNKLEEFLSKNSPIILKSLNEGASENDLDESEKILNIKLDDEMRCFYRIHNGQKIVGNEDDDSSITGLFGGFEVYDYHVNLQYLPIQALQTFKRGKLPIKWLNWCIPIIKCYGGPKTYFMVVEDGPGDFKRGRIVEPSEGYANAFAVADNITSLFEDLAANLETGNYEISKTDKQQIIRYPMKEISEETTKGVKIQCSPLFVAERSSCLNHFFAYKIHMSMSKEYSSVDKCKLTTRHWIITNGNKQVEEVKGPGVIGFYPEMYPGAEFEYASCCPIKTLTGSMKGFFNMKRIDGTTFDAVVPEYFFKTPQVLSESGTGTSKGGSEERKRKVRSDE